MGTPLNFWSTRFLFLGLVLWTIGALSLEAIASVGGLLTFLVWAVERLRGHRLNVREFLPAWLPLFSYVAWSLLAPMASGFFPGATGVARQLELLFIPVAAWGISSLDAPQRRSLFLWGAGVFLVSCLLAALQHYGVWPSEAFFQPLSWTKIAFYRVYESIPGDAPRFMAGGMTFHRLRFAHTGGLFVLVALAVALALRGRAKVAWTCVGFGTVAIFLFPHARMAAGALVVSLGAMLVWGMKRRRQLLVSLLSLIFFVGAVFALSHSVRERFLSSLDARGNGDRQHLWEAGLAAVSSAPLTGVGAGNFNPGRFSTAITPENVREHPGKAHNQFLSVAAESGVPGLLLLVWAMVSLIRRFRLETMEGLAGLGGLFFFVLLSLAHDPWFHSQFVMAFCLVMGLGLSHSDRRPRKDLSP